MKKILLCLDADPQPSAFDAIVAIDAGVDQLLRHGGVLPEQVRDLVYGAMFTRSGAELKNTAVFVGGSDVGAGEALLAAVTKSFFGPVRTSVMLDANGCNTTAAAAVLAAARHVSLQGTMATVLAGTGAVGRRVARLLASEGVRVRLASRSLTRAEQACSLIRQEVPSAELTALATDSVPATAAAIEGSQAIFCCGAPGVQILNQAQWAGRKGLEVVVDLNAVPPVGAAGIEPMDKGVVRQGTACYGAICVGGMKMKIHKAAIARLFETNELVLDAAEIFALGKELEANKAGG